MNDGAPAAHPSDELLKAYAAGWLARAASLCVAVHLERCEPCGVRLAAEEDAQAQFVEALPEAPMDAARLSELMAKLEAVAVQPAPRERTLGDVVLPQALLDARIGRRRWLRPGYWLAPLPEVRAERWRAYLLRLPAGQAVPVHGHRGQELICVLQGSFEARGAYAAGDFVEVSPEVEHSLQAGDEPCACLVASEGPLVLAGTAKLLRPVLPI